MRDDSGAHQSLHRIGRIWEIIRRKVLFLFHQSSDFFGFDSIDIAGSIAETHGTVMATAHDHETSEGDVEAAHQLLGQWGDLLFFSIHFYCCHIV